MKTKILFKGNISINQNYAILLGTIISARTGIERKLAKTIGNGNHKNGFKKIEEMDSNIGKLLDLLKEARDLAAHEEIDNYEEEFEKMVSLCENFIDNVNQLYPDGWKYCSAEKNLIAGLRSYSPFEKAIEIVFHEIQRKFGIELENSISLDGFHPYGTPSLSERVSRLVNLEPSIQQFQAPDEGIAGGAK